MAIRLFGLLMALASARMYTACKQFPTASDNQLGEIAQVQLIFSFLYALLLKLDNGADNSTGYSSEFDNYLLDNLMVVVSFAGVGLALMQPVLGRLLERCGGQGDVEGIDDVEGIAIFSGGGNMEEVLQETLADIGEANQVDLDDDVAAGAESNQVDDDIEMGSSVPQARPEAREAEGQSERPKQVEPPKHGLKGRHQSADSVQTPSRFAGRNSVGTGF